jgi:hypothetical protein
MANLLHRVNRIDLLQRNEPGWRPSVSDLVRIVQMIAVWPFGRVLAMLFTCD